MFKKALLWLLSLVLLCSLAYASDQGGQSLEDPFREIGKRAVLNGKFGYGPLGYCNTEKKLLYDGRLVAFIGICYTRENDAVNVIFTLTNPRNARFVSVREIFRLDGSGKTYLIRSGKTREDGSFKFDIDAAIDSLYARRLAWEFLAHWEELNVEEFESLLDLEADSI